MLEGIIAWIGRLPLHTLTDRGVVVAVALLLFLWWVLLSGKRTRRLAMLLKACRRGP